MRKVLLLVSKDLRLLGRSPALLASLVLYPLVVALLVGMVVRYAGEAPRVALVDNDGLPETLSVGGMEFDVNGTIERVAEDVKLVPMDEEEADRKLETGEVLAAIVIPDGFARQLRGMVQRPVLELRLTKGAAAATVRQQIEALVYNLNQDLQQAYIRSNLEQIGLLVEGGSGSFLGEDFTVIGLDGADERLAELERSPDAAVAERARELAVFVRQVRIAIDRTGDALRSTANPIVLETETGRGRVALLSTQVQAYALALTITFVGILLAAATLAAERDENVIGRLARGLVGRGQLVSAKVVLVALVGGAIGVVLALVFGVVVEAADVTGGAAWGRLPVLALGLVLASAAVGAFGAIVGVLAREARAATLVAFLVSLPIILLGLVPQGSLPAAGAISDAFPFVHAVRYADAALGAADPSGELAVEAGWLAGLGLVYAALARAGVRRLLA